MMLIYGHDAAVAAWVAARIPHVGADGFGPCAAVGVARGGELVAGVVWHDYQVTPVDLAGTLQCSMAADSPLWATPGTLRELLRYPFMQLGVRLIWTATPHTNERAIRFNLGIGFRREATLSERFAPKTHAVICHMKRSDWQRKFGG